MRSSLAFLSLAAVLLVAPGIAAAAGHPTRALRYPTLTPDGKQVVFCYRGDIWIAPLSGETPALRLTLHVDQDTIPRVSPDGKRIAFSSRRAGGYDLYVMPVTGGEPERVTFNGGVEILCDWSPDGKRLLFASDRDGGLDLYEAEIGGGTPRRITFTGGREGSYSPDGKLVVFDAGSGNIYWDDYEGSANFDLYVTDREGGLPRRLTHTKGNERWPTFSADGKTIRFVAEEGKVANFYSMPAEGGERKQVTAYTGTDVLRPDVGWDFKTAVYERLGELYVVDLTNPSEKPDRLAIRVVTDVRNSGIENRTITAGGEQVHVSRDGQAAFTLHGDLWVMPAGGGRGRRVTSGAANDQWPRFSPDGKRLAFHRTDKGNTDLYLLDLASGATTRLTRDKANDFFASWSPDGRKLVFTSERSGNRDIWVLDLETGDKTRLTTDKAGDDDAVFSPDGRSIAFDSGRGGAQAIWIMNADGSNPRRVTQGSGFYQVPSFSPDGTMISYESMRPTSARSGGVYVTLSSGGPSVMVSRDGQTPFWSPIGDYIYFHANRSGQGEGIYRVRAPDGVEPGERVPFIGQVEVDTRKELAALFDEAWTALKDGFYDPKMHGLDWNAIRDRYRAMAIDCEVKDEFQNVIRQMLAELSSSHLGIGGGRRNGNSVTPAAEATGNLGLTFGPAEGAKGFEISEVEAGGPADSAGLRVGDVVVRIGKVALGPKVNLDKVLGGTTGNDLEITYRPLSAAGLGDARKLTLKPISMRDLRSLRYRNWERRCTSRVRGATRGRWGEVGYVHLSQMDPQNLQKFQQAVIRWNSSRRIKGMILDVRNNGGGNIHNQLMQVFMTQPLARIQMRGRPKMVTPSLYWDKPVVLLINQRSFSDAEVFPAMFREAGVGKIVGVPTGGGVIGTRNITLSDGTTFRVPMTGFWTMDGKNLEGLGVKPDFLVEETPEDLRNDRDPQLEKAIAVILEDVKAREEKKKPAKKPATPAKKPEPAPKKPAPESKTPAPTVGPENPLADVEAGEWVRYRYRDPQDGAKTTIRVTAAEVAADRVRFTTELESGGAAALPLPDVLPRVPLAKLLPGYGKVLTESVTEGKLGGRPAKLLIVELESPDGHLRLTFSNEVKGYGLHLAELNKQVVLEAIDWGGPEKPEAAPAKPETPAAKPAAAAAATEAPDHPVWDAKPGEWVKIKRLMRGAMVTMILTVNDVTDDTVVLGQKILVQGREIPGPDMDRKRDRKLEAPEGFTLSGYTEEKVEVAGRTLTCTVMTATGPEGNEWKWYVCPEVPVNGYVRVVRDGTVLVELIEWGEE